MITQAETVTVIKDRQPTQRLYLAIKQHFTRRQLVLGILIALAVSSLPLPAFAQAPAKGPTIISQAWLPTQTVDGKFKEVMITLELAPGAGVPSHTHGGPTLVTVLDGEITLKENGVETTYKTGQSWTEMPGHKHEAYNATDKPVRVVFTVLLSGNAEALIPASDQPPSRPAPTILYQSEFPDLTVDGVFDETMIVLELAPGAGIPTHTHAGPVLVTVLDGEITLKENGADTSYAAGKSWTETPGHKHEIVNASDKPVRVVFTVLLPVPPPLTVVDK